MLKNILSFLFLFPFLILNAQVEHSSKALEISIASEAYRQHRSFTVQNEQFGFDNNALFSVISPKFTDGHARRLTLAIGSKRFDDKDNYHAWGIFGAGSSWDRMQVLDIQDSLGVTVDQERERVGIASEFTLGLRYTFGLALTHKPNLNFLIGFRGEIGDSFIDAPSEIASAFDLSLNFAFLRTYILPEMQYVFPNSPLKMSLKLGLPMFSMGVDSSKSSNPGLSVEQQRSSGMYFDNFSWGKANVLELGFGYFLKSK